MTSEIERCQVPRRYCQRRDQHTLRDAFKKIVELREMLALLREPVFLIHQALFVEDLEGVRVW
jgi:hypothetical protein